MYRIAAIDLGTNTFHMIITEINDNQELVIFRKRIFVKLANKGFEFIDQEAKQKGILALMEFKNALISYNVSTYKAYATSIFRRAKNGSEFAIELEKLSGIDIEVIDGKKEAELIFFGAKKANALKSNYNLIIDIGGGSVEFIIADKESILYDKSFPIGILELFHRFSYLEPFNKNSIKLIHEFIKSSIPELIMMLKNYPVKNLVGTAGAFEVLLRDKEINKNEILFEISSKEFIEFYESIAFLPFNEIQKRKEIPKERQKLIIYAFSLIKVALDITNSKVINVTSNSMKEGIIYKILLDKK